MPRQKYKYYTYKVINKINNKNKFPFYFLDLSGSVVAETEDTL